MKRQVTWRSAPDSALGLLWLVLAAAKAFDAQRASYLQDLLGTGMGAMATWLVLLSEFGLGGALVSGGSTSVRRARGLSAAALAALGLVALFSQPRACGCAGQVANLSGSSRLLLITAMLSLTGLAWSLEGPERERQDHRQSRIDRRLGRIRAFGFLAVFVVAGGLLVAHLLRRDPSEQHDPSAGTFSRSTDRVSSPELVGRADIPAASERREDGASTEYALIATTCSVRVLSGESESPVLGARVTLWAPDAGVVSLGTTTTDGIVGLQVPDGLSSLPQLSLFVVARGWRVWRAELRSLVPRDSVYTVHLRRSATITGTVVDELERPIEGVRVQARGVNSEDIGWSPEVRFWDTETLELAEDLTDLSGAFVLSGLSAGDVGVVARKAGYSAAVGARGEPLSVQLGEQDVANVRVVLRSLYEAAIQVLDDVSGAPLAVHDVRTKISSGRPWAFAGTPTANGPEDPAALPSRSVAGFRGSTFARVGEEDARTPVEFQVSAPGFQSAHALVVPTPVGASRPTEVRLRRDTTEPLIPVTFRLVLGERTRGPSGAFALQVKSESGSAPTYSLAVGFVDGVSSAPVLLPAGSYAATLKGVSGAVAFWQRPLREKRHRFEVAPVGDAFVDLPCAGGMVCVSPMSELGRAVREYTLAVESGSLSLQHETWELAMERRTCGPRGEAGHVFWLDAGPTQLFLAKIGYQTQQLDVVIAQDASMTSWAPTVQRVPVVRVR